MSVSRFKAGGVIGGVLGLVFVAGWSFAQRRVDLAKPETLLPANAVICVVSDGSLLHEEAYRKTAAYEALHQSGLMETLHKIVAVASAQSPQVGLAWEAIEHLQTHGLSMAIAVDPPGQGPPMPWGVVVVHQAADGGVDAVKQLLGMFPDVRLDFREERIRGRRVQKTMIPMSPIEVGLWSEGGHLLIAFGIDGINSAIAVAEQERDNMTTSKLWERFAPGHQSFDANSVAWFDFAPLKQMFGEMPVPIPGQNQPLTVNHLLQATGLQNFNSVTMVSGVQGKHHWSEVILDFPNDGSQLIPITWNDLPPIPAGHAGVLASSINWEAQFDSLLTVLRNVARISPQGSDETVDHFLGQVEQVIGFPPRALATSLGHVNCIYSDSFQGMFGLGATALVSVKEQATLKRILERIMNLVQQEAGQDVRVRQVEKQGRTLTVVEFPQAPFLTPTFCVDEKWLIIGLVPQSVEATLLRLDGKLSTWTPDDHVTAALQELPTEFVSLTISDPRDTYRFLIGFAPTLIGFAELGMRQSRQVPPDFRFPISISDFPPTELVISPLYPNVTMTTGDEHRTHFYSRQSLPGVPLIGGGSSGTASVATTSVLIALLLPAVQQARMAARISQSKNNLKQIGLAMHNYHDVYNHFPQGTLSNDDLEVEERLSWLVSILPFIDQAALYNVMAREAGWEAAGNARAVHTRIPVYINPNEPVAQDADGRPVTHYVGVAGLGKDGPTLPVTDKNAGVFAYDRVTRMRDIRDGTSNTIAVGEANQHVGPWAAGGAATIRPFTQKPYFNGPDGFGASTPHGANFLFADGSVRVISDKVDPSVMEALTTINGGERIGGF